MQTELKDKHINIRITPTILDRIESIKDEMEGDDGMLYSRSQIIFMLINKGIEKYYENGN